MTIISDLPDLAIEQVSITNEVTITVRATSPTAPCPCCGTISKRVQSHYTRTLRDLPASGRPVELIVRVRRFFCQQSTCLRKIFAERFPSLTLPRVKFTLRLQETLGEMGFALGGEAGARLGRQLSIPGSPDTLLRLVKLKLPPVSSPRVVGIDDWSWRRRLRYGTLICDLESSKPIDVLPDRSVETVSAWFEEHPTVEIVSRDRSSEYAAAIRKGAPQALQVADLWHIGKNLTDSVQTLLARCRAEIRCGLRVQATPEQEREETEAVPQEERHPARSRSDEQARVVDALKSWIDTRKSSNFMTRGLQRLRSLLGLESPDERFSDGCATAPFQKPDGGADDLASSSRMNATSSRDGKRDAITAYSSIEK